MFYDILRRVVLGFQMRCGLKITNIRELRHHLTPGQGRICRGVGAQTAPKTGGQLGCRGTLVSGTERRGIKCSSLFWTAPLCVEAPLVTAVGLEP